VSYEAEVSRSNPSAFLFLIDTSGSMLDPFGGGTGRRKAEGVADAINQLLQNLAIKCSKSEGIRDYYEVGVISYGKDVKPAFAGKLAGKAVAPVSEVANNPARLVERTKKVEDGNGGLVDQKVKSPVWFEPKAAGKTPMCEALRTATQTMSSWVESHPFSYPPVVINITDGESTDGDPSAEAEGLTELATQDGNVLLFNCHISSSSNPSTLFPDTQEGLPDQYAKTLYEMSSRLPETIRDAAKREGFQVSEETRGFGFNAELVELIRFLDIGTRPSNLR
jgi:hypothetical protein